MFGIGMPELIVILVVALVVIGPKNLPELARALGKGYGEFQRALRNLKDSVDYVEKDLDSTVNRLEDPSASEEPPTSEGTIAPDSKSKTEKGTGGWKNQQ